jgi:hypothetical protein
MLFIIGGLVVFGVIAYQAGLFDRPEFKYYDSLLAAGEGEEESFLYTVLAFSNEKQIVKHFERLLDGVSKGLIESVGQSKINGHMQDAVNLYNKGRKSVSDHETNMMSAGLYFDDPNTVDEPRWEKSGLSEPIRIVRVGGKGTTILKGTIPYHNMLTPMLAPMIQWTRAYKAYEDGKYSTTTNRSGSDAKSAPALELYHSSGDIREQGCRMRTIEYIVLMGDVTQTWNDAIPISKVETATTI